MIAVNAGRVLYMKDNDCGAAAHGLHRAMGTMRVLVTELGSGVLAWEALQAAVPERRQSIHGQKRNEGVVCTGVLGFGPGDR